MREPRCRCRKGPCESWLRGPACHSCSLRLGGTSVSPHCLLQSSSPRVASGGARENTGTCRHVTLSEPHGAWSLLEHPQKCQPRVCDRLTPTDAGSRTGSAAPQLQEHGQATDQPEVSGSWSAKWACQDCGGVHGAGCVSEAPTSGFLDRRRHHTLGTS